MNINHKVLDAAIARCEQEIRRQQTAAIESGRWFAGSANGMQGKVDAFKAGLHCEIPDFLKKHYDQIIKEDDSGFGE